MGIAGGFHEAWKLLGKEASCWVPSVKHAEATCEDKGRDVCFLAV